MLRRLVKELEALGAPHGVEAHIGRCEGKCARVELTAGAKVALLEVRPAGLLLGWVRKGQPTDVAVVASGDVALDGFARGPAARHALAARWAPLARELDDGLYDPRSILDVGVETLVARGLKPIARIAAPHFERERERLSALLPVVVEGADPFAFTRAGRISQGSGSTRFLYIGHDRPDVMRVAELDEILFGLRGPLLDVERSRTLRREQGLLLGYPACCVEWFAADRPATALRDEIYDLASALSWSGRIVDPRLSFVAASLYKIAVLSHVPHGADCQETATRTGTLVRALYSPYCQRVVVRLLETCCVVWADGRLVPFERAGSDGDAVLVRGFNRLAWPELATEASRLRAVPAEPDDDEVSALRVRDGTLEVNSGVWRRYEPGGPPLTGHPLVLLFGRGT